MSTYIVAVAAAARKELRVARRDPLSLLTSLLFIPLYQFMLPVLLLGAAFVVHGQAIGLSTFTGTTDFGGWLAIGMMGASVTSSVLAGPAHAITVERNTGALEQMWAMPVKPSAIVLGFMASMVSLSLLSGLLMIGLVALLFGAHFQVIALLSFGVFVALLPGLAGMGLMSASVALRWRQTIGLAENLGYVVAVLGSVTFPVAAVSTDLQLIAYPIPTTWAIDLARHLALRSEPILPLPVEIGALLLTSGVCLAGGRLAFARMERRLRADGTVVQH